MMQQAAAASEERSVEAVLDVGRRAGLPDRTMVELLRALGMPRRDAYRRVSGR